MDAATFRDAVIAWDSDSDMSISSPARDRMIAAAKELFGAMCGVRKVAVDYSPGSTYIAITPDHDDACEVTVRISNHARKPNSHLPPAWSFEPSDKVTSYSAGIHAVQAAIADEIVNARDQE